jgi:hypothetical protein
VPLKKTSSSRKTVVATPPPRDKRSPPALRDVKDSRAPTTESAFPHLTPTATPGIYVNKEGAFVDSRGVLFSLTNIAQETEADVAERLIGGPIDSPAKLLKMIALDPMRPMMVRIDAAKAAAPYFDRKTPVSIENKNEDLTLDALAIAQLPAEKRRELLAMLKALGVDIGGGKK